MFVLNYFNRMICKYGSWNEITQKQKREQNAISISRHRNGRMPYARQWPEFLHWEKNTVPAHHLNVQVPPTGSPPSVMIPSDWILQSIKMCQYCVKTSRSSFIISPITNWHDLFLRHKENVNLVKYQMILSLCKESIFTH